MNSPSRRPRVICHMIATIDGRIVTEHWPDIGEGRQEYERTGRRLTLVAVERRAEGVLWLRYHVEATAPEIRRSLGVSRG